MLYYRAFSVSNDWTNERYSLTFSLMAPCMILPQWSWFLRCPPKNKNGRHNIADIFFIIFFLAEILLKMSNTSRKDDIQNMYKSLLMCQPRSYYNIFIFQYIQTTNVKIPQTTTDSPVTLTKHSKVGINNGGLATYV